MKAARWIILAIGLLGIACFFAFPKLFRKDASSPLHAKYKLGSYFVPFEIIGFNHQGIPCISIVIEHQTIPVALDLGSSGEICLYGEIFSQLKEKNFLRLRKSRGFLGHEYEKKIYNIPKIQIGAVSFWHPLLDEESESFRNDAIISETKDAAPLEKGRLGWRLFHNTNLFLDLGNSKIALCDSLATLTKNGYAADAFVRVPLLLDHNVIEIDIARDHRPMRCYLDTGSTWNILNSEEPSAIVTSPFALNEVAFEPLTFHPLPIRYPFSVDAILGMEFFADHLILLDFSENCAYIAKKRGPRLECH